MPNARKLGNYILINMRLGDESRELAEDLYSLFKPIEEWENKAKI